MKALPEILEAALDSFDDDQHDDRTKGKAASWLKHCLKGTHGVPLAVLANVLLGLREQWPDVVAYDEMLCAPVLTKSLTGENSFTPRPVTDVDVGILQEQLQHVGLKRVAKDVVHQAVDIRAAECRFHPLLDYLEGLVWDRQPRLNKLLPTYFGTQPGIYTEFDRQDVSHIDGGPRDAAWLQGRSSSSDRRSAGNIEKLGVQHPRRRVVFRQSAGDQHRRQRCQSARERQMVNRGFRNACDEPCRGRSIKSFHHSNA